MKKYGWILCAGILVLGILHYVFRPWLEKRESDQTLQTILHHFENGDFTLVSEHWISRSGVPPIVKIDRYQITESLMVKNRKRPQTRYRITLDFDRSRETVLPSGKTWEVVMEKTPDGWRVGSFNLL
jgi:hypothetical protein